jgi:peptide/nickel transport system substrate-binding protein
MGKDKIFYRNIVVATTVLVAALMLFGSSGQTITTSTLSQSSPPAATGGNTTFTVGWAGTYIDTLNPFLSYSELTYFVNLNVYLHLVNFNTNNDSVTPSLASSWVINYANHTAIFHINPDAVWSDGQQVTSQDVIYSYETAGQNYTFVSSYVTAITNMTALNPKTVMITFNGVLWEMFAAYLFIVPYHIWKSIDPATYPGYNANGTPYFVGDGPFVLTKYVPNQYAEIQKNPNWFIKSETPKLNTVIFEEFSSESSAIASMEDGSIQGLSGLLPANVPQFENNSAFVFTKSPGMEYQYLSIDVEKGSQGNPTLRNVTVRQAIAHALNYTYLAETVYHGYATPLASVLSPSNEYYDHNLQPYSYNVKLANEMLNASGYTMGSNGVRVSPNGTELSYTLICNSADTLATSLAQLVAKNLTAIGIKVNVIAETTGSMAAQIWLSNGTLGQDMDVWDWDDNTPFAPELLSVFLSGQVVTGTSDSGFNNTTYDNLWNELLSAPSQSQAMNISYQMQEILHYQLPYIPLVDIEALTVWSSSFTDINASFVGGPFGGFDYRTFITASPVSVKKTTAPDYLLYAVIIAVIAIIIIAVAAVALVRNRKKSNTPP